MVVLLALVAAGAFLWGLPGALGAYVLGLVAFAFLPGEGGACAVPPERRAHDEPDAEAGIDDRARKSPPAA